MKNYNTKSNDSFKARLRFYLYYCVTKKENKTSLDEFISFDIDKPDYEKFVLEYTSQYYQLERKEKIKGIDKSLDDIYADIKNLENQFKPNISEWQLKYRKEVFEIKFPKNEFEKLDEKGTCFYCNLSINEIEQLRSKEKLFKKNERGYNLELDRKLPNREYSVENCVMACYWCNNAKTDEFTAEEFKPIGELIGQTLKARLK